MLKGEDGGGLCNSLFKNDPLDLVTLLLAEKLLMNFCAII